MAGNAMFKKLMEHGRGADVVMQKGKRGGAAFINAECVNGPPYEHLDNVLDVILDPGKKIDSSENIEWCKWLIAGGRTPAEFAAIGEYLIRLLICHSIDSYFVNILSGLSRVADNHENQ